MSDITLFITDFYRIMDRIGMPVAKEKMLGPTAILEYLGSVLNFFKQTVGIPEKKWEKCLDLINKLIQAHKSKSKVTVKLIQKNCRFTKLHLSGLTSRTTVLGKSLQVNKDILRSKESYGAPPAHFT